VTEVSSKSAIWQVLEHLRGELPPHDIVVALAALIYLRWADFQEAEQEAIAAFDDVDYKAVLPSSLHWRSWHLLPRDELQGFFADRLSHTLEQLNNSRHISLATHLHRTASIVKSLGQLSPRSLDTIIRWLADQPFETPSDRRALLDVYDAVLDKALDKHSDEFRTPVNVARLLVEIASPAAGDRIYDPCFGSAGLLTIAYDRVLRQEKDLFGRRGAPALAIFGVERNLNAYIIGLSRLALAGIDNPQLELGNSLERTSTNSPLRDGFDVVLANPPWGLRADPAGMDHFPVRTTDTTGLFIQHALSQLRPEGRAVVVVPQGFLFRGGPEQRLRRMLLEQHTVEAVISLPHGVFLPYTGIQASVLVLRRNGPTKRIRMIDTEPFFEKGKGAQPATIRQTQIENMAQRLREPIPGKHCWDVDPETLAEVDWDFTPKRRDQSSLMSILNALRSVEIIPLKECSQILMGRAIKSSDLVDAPEGKEPIPYIRIRDVQRGQATKGSSWLTQDAAAAFDARWKLRTGDVLLSKSGTIGKSGVVRNGAVAAAAASGLFILRPNSDRLDPHFLAAYLDSSECRVWLDDKARGATIRHLSRQVLDEMPVPLPPLQIQHRVAAYHRESRGDSLTFLTQLLVEGTKDPIAEWLLSAFGNLPSVEYETAELPGDRLSDLAESGLLLIDDQISNEDIIGELQGWFVLLRNVMALIIEIESIPQGPALYSLLQQVDKDLTVASLAPPEGPYGNAADKLVRVLSAWSDKNREHLLTSTKVTAATNISTIRKGNVESLSLEFHNSGKLPLRYVLITTDPDCGKAEFDYLPENSSVSFDLSVTTPKVLGTWIVTINWSGMALDGRPVNGKIELPFEIIDHFSSRGDAFSDLGGSPYICGDPVRPDRKDVFFGREELIEQIRRQVIQSGNVVLLEGNRRSGKSSILWQLEGVNSVPGWLGVYCSFQKAKGSDKNTGVPTAEVFRLIAEDIARAVYHNVDKKISLPNGKEPPRGPKLSIDDRKRFGIASRESISEEAPFSDFCNYIEFVLEELAERELGLLLMLDEFDKLQEGIDNKVTSPQVPENIRYLVQSYPRISAILTGSRRLKRLREEYWSVLFGLGTRFSVTSLPEEPARLLITEPVKKRLTYAREAVNRAIYLTACQPYLMQCLCNRIFDMSVQLKTRSVTMDLVDKAADALIEDNEHFATLWGYAESHRRRFILMLIHKEGAGPDPLRLGVIQERLISYGIEVDDESLIADIEFLRELELIELVGDTGGGYYVLSIPLMGSWIKKQQDFAAVLSNARSETEDHHE